MIALWGSSSPIVSYELRSSGSLIISGKLQGRIVLLHGLEFDHTLLDGKNEFEEQLMG